MNGYGKSGRDKGRKRGGGGEKKK
jgi:hypothetical protein